MIPQIGTEFSVSSIDECAKYKIVAGPFEDMEGRLFVLVDRMKKTEIDGRLSFFISSCVIFPVSMIPTSYGFGLTPGDMKPSGV